MRTPLKSGVQEKNLPDANVCFGICRGQYGFAFLEIMSTTYVHHIVKIVAQEKNFEEFMVMLGDLTKNKGEIKDMYRCLP